MEKFSQLKDEWIPCFHWHFCCTFFGLSFRRREIKKNYIFVCFVIKFMFFWRIHHVNNLQVLQCFSCSFAKKKKKESRILEMNHLVQFSPFLHKKCNCRWRLRKHISPGSRVYLRPRCSDCRARRIRILFIQRRDLIDG